MGGFLLVLICGFLVSSYCIKHNMYYPEFSKMYETYSHRFSGYTIMTQLGIKDLIFGINSIKELPSNIVLNNGYLYIIMKFNEFCGLPNMVIHYGILITFIYILLLNSLKLKTSEYFILTLSTITVNYTTLTSFVILIYFLVLSLSTNRKIGE